jgi:hypothetical protein
VTRVENTADDLRLLRNWNSIGFVHVASVVVSGPLFTANVTEFVLAPAGHVIASLRPFNDEFAVFALSEVQIVLKEVDFFLVAVSLVLLKVTLCTEFTLALVAYPCLVLGDFDDSFAIFLGTQFQGRVVRCHVKLVRFQVLLPDFLRKVSVEFGFRVHDKVAPFLRTQDFLEHFDFVRDVISDAVLTVRMLAFAKIDNIPLVKDSQTNPT